MWYAHWVSLCVSVSLQLTHLVTAGSYCWLDSEVDENVLCGGIIGLFVSFLGKAGLSRQLDPVPSSASARAAWRLRTIGVVAPTLAAFLAALLRTR